ncbi:MAG: glycosyltransferase [Pricia sp.]
MQNKTVLIIGFTWPEPASTAAGNRMLQLLRYFKEREYRIVFTSTAVETTLSMDLEAMGIEKTQIKLNDSSFDEFLRNLRPNVVVFDRFLTEEQFGWRVDEFAPQALRVLDTEDLHSLRTTRQALLKKNIPFSVDAWLENETTKREIASIYRCDVSLIISSYEMQLLTETLKINQGLLLYLPFMLENLDERSVKSWPSFESRKDFVCIGNGKHAPNIDAIIWLKQEIWPLIRKALPDANLTIYGAYLPERILQMDNTEEGFRVMGWAESADQVLKKARVGLAPLRFGAGIKGKLIDAMQAGTPTVTTSIGAEGMCSSASIMDILTGYANTKTKTWGSESADGFDDKILDFPWNGLIADTAEDFADAAISLYQNEQEWTQAQQNATPIINKLYDKRLLERKLDAAITAIQDKLKMHRTRNFIGAMLSHHTLTSTKYMAKWIEAKNNGN